MLPWTDAVAANCDELGAAFPILLVRGARGALTAEAAVLPSALVGPGGSGALDASTAGPANEPAAKLPS